MSDSPDQPPASRPQTCDLALPDLVLERGGTVRRHRVRVWSWGPQGETLDQLEPDVPTVLLVHALTGSARAGGPDGWWAPLIGPGQAFDPELYRVVCFNNLGSFYGTSAPGLPGFPAGRNVTLTPVDIARSILLALDALGIRRVHLAAGGSLGGMIVLTLAALAPDRIERVMPIATSATASAWVVGWNHIAREVIRLDPGYPHDVSRGLELARQMAMLTYRAEPGLETNQHRHLPVLRGFKGYRVQGYLEHHGRKLNSRFIPRCYELMLDAMDHHDLARPLPGDRVPALSRIQAPALVVDVDTDQLFTPAQAAELARQLRERKNLVESATIHSPHGHDAFLLEWEQLAPLVRRALHLPLSKS